jgi:hypothetical protein
MSRWEDKMKRYLKGTEQEGMDWINLAQDRDEWQALMNMVMKPELLHKSVNFSTR